MAQVTINGQGYGLRFDLAAMEAVEAEFGGLKEMLAQFNSGEGRIETVKRMFVILANSQRGFEGAPEDVTVAALRHAPLWVLGELGEAITEAMKESMRVETMGGGEADDDAHDAFLEELESKNG